MGEWAGNTEFHGQAGRCPKCHSEASVVPHGDGAMCKLCRSSWVGIEYAAAVEAEAKKVRKINEELFRRSRADTSPLDSIATWLQSEGGKGVVSVVQQMFSKVKDSEKEEKDGEGR